MNLNIKEKPPPTLGDTHLFKFLYLISQSINNSHKAPRNIEYQICQKISF